MYFPGCSGRSGASLHKILQYLPCLKQSADICGYFRHLGTKRELKKRGLFYEGGKKIGFDGLCVDIQKSKSFNS